MNADPVQSSITLQSLLIVILTLINVYSAANEMTIVSANKNRAHCKMEEGNRKTMLMEELLQEPANFSSAIQVAITPVGFFNSAGAATGISVCLGAVLEAWAISYGETTSMVVVTILLSFVTLIFGELIPRRIALQNVEAYSMFCAKPTLIASKIASPFTRTLSWPTRFVLRLPDMKDENVKESLSHEETCSMAESGQESGLFGEDEADMVDNTFASDDTLAEGVMTPRPGVFCIDVDDSQSKYLDKLMEMRYSRIPIYRNSINDIISILSIKDLTVEARESGFEHVDISCILRKPFLVLEGKNIDDLFREMQGKHQHIAILVDKYGSFSGIVTMEDLVEKVMGDIENGYDGDDEAQIEKLDEHTYVLNGGTPTDDINEELELWLENDNHKTISGLLLNLIGQIPEGGEEREIIWNHIKFQVKEVKYKRIHKVQLVPMQEEGNSEEV